jgi:HEPN domain-containing protein
MSFMNEELHRIALAWLEKARHDLETARRMLEGAEPITDTAVYHCQQAAEKSLKAVLVRAVQPVFKTQVLMLLLTKCAANDRSFTQWIDLASALHSRMAWARYGPAGRAAGAARSHERAAAPTALVTPLRRCHACPWRSAPGVTMSVSTAIR